MYYEKEENNFFSSTPIPKVKNKSYSNPSEEYITKKLLNNSTEMAIIMKSLNRCMKERKKFEQQLIDISFNKNRNDNKKDKTDYSCVSESTTWTTTEFSSIEKPRKLTRSQNDYTTTTINSGLNDSFMSSNPSKIKLQQHDGDHGDDGDCRTINDHHHCNCNSDKLTSVTNISPRSPPSPSSSPSPPPHLSPIKSPKPSNLLTSPFNDKLFSCDASILDIDAINAINFEESLLQEERSDDSSISSSSSSSSSISRRKLNDTIDREELKNLNFNSNESSIRDFVEMSTFRSKDLIGNRKTLEELSVLKTQEKVIDWLERKRSGNNEEGNTNKSRIVTMENEISEKEESVDSDIELNFEGEEEEGGFNSNSHWDFTKVSSENQQINRNHGEFVSELNEALKRNSSTDYENDEGMFSDEIKDHSQRENFLIFSSTLRSKKNKIIHEYNQSKYPLIEDDSDWETVDSDEMKKCEKNSEKIAKLIKENEVFCEYQSKIDSSAERIRDLQRQISNDRKYNSRTSSKSYRNNKQIMKNNEEEEEEENFRIRKFTTQNGANNNNKKNNQNRIFSGKSPDIHSDLSNSRNTIEDNKENSLEQQSQISICYENIIRLLEENEQLRESLSGYKDNVYYKETEIVELLNRLNENKIAIRKYRHLLDSTKKNNYYNLVKLENDNNRLRDIIVEQTVLFINEYPQERKMVRSIDKCWRDNREWGEFNCS